MEKFSSSEVYKILRDIYKLVGEPELWRKVKHRLVRHSKDKDDRRNTLRDEVNRPRLLNSYLIDYLCECVLNKDIYKIEVLVPIMFPKADHNALIEFIEEIALIWLRDMEKRVDLNEKERIVIFKLRSDILIKDYLVRFSNSVW